MKDSSNSKDKELEILDFNESEETEDVADSEGVSNEAEEWNGFSEEAEDLDDDLQMMDEDIKEPRKHDKKKEKSGNLKKEIISWVMTFVVALALALVLKNYVLINASVPTGSMQNTIQPDDRLFGSRLAYLKEGPKRGDVIFFYFPDDESQKFVKRVIGLPGEKVTIIEGKIYINDSAEPLDEPYLKEEWVRGTGPYEFIVPEDGYFCLGDNRNSSQDARYWVNTYVMKDKIIGKALYIYYPFEHMGVVE